MNAIKFIQQHGIEKAREVMRSEFEKTRTFKSIYSTLMYFDESLDLYIAKEKWREEDARRLTYVWWAYKELQTKIDSKNEIMTDDFVQWFTTTSYFGAYFTDLDLNLNHRDQFENDIINSAWHAFQHQQSKVDELQKKLIFREKAYENLKLQLQNRDIDSEIDEKKINELEKQLIDQGQRFNEHSQRFKDLEHKNGELQKRVDAFKDHALMLREAAKSHVYTEREQNILLSQAEDIDKILGLEQALKGGCHEGG